MMLEEIRIAYERMKNSITDERKTTHILHTVSSPALSTCIISVSLHFFHGLCLGLIILLFVSERSKHMKSIAMWLKKRFVML